MFVQIQATPGRRVRHVVSRRVLMHGETYRVEWGPAWQRKLDDGDIVKAPNKDHRNTPEVSE